jgi:hypothetical protein
VTSHCAFPVDALVRLYHARWKIESAYLALRQTLLGGWVLRSGGRPAVEQDLRPCSASTRSCVWPWSQPSRPARHQPISGQFHHRPWKPP